MRITLTKVIGLLAVAALAVPDAARAANIQIWAYSTRVIAPAFHEAPNDQVMVGDKVEFAVALCFDGEVSNPEFSFTTNAPVTNVLPGPPVRTRLVPTNPTEPCGAVARGFPTGSAVFTTAGRYQVTLHASAVGAAAPATRTFDIVVGELRAYQPPLSVATCMAPKIKITSPTASTGLCVGRTSHVNASVALHGCTPYTLTVSVRNPGGKTQKLPSRTSAPWSVVFTPAAGGTYTITAQIRDRNGATATDTVTVNAVVCPSLPLIQPKH